MFSKELTLLWQAWLRPETSAPEQLWVLSRGRHSSETHFRLPLESEGVEEFDVKSVDRFLLRKCLSRTEKLSLRSKFRKIFLHWLIQQRSCLICLPEDRGVLWVEPGQNICWEWVSTRNKWSSSELWWGLWRLWAVWSRRQGSFQPLQFPLSFQQKSLACNPLQLVMQLFPTKAALRTANGMML